MTTLRKRHLGRRAFLGGSAVAVSLPWLESLAPRRLRSAQAAPGDEPRRLISFFVPNGIHMPGFTPAATGPDYPVSPILSSLAELQYQLIPNVLVLSGLDNAPSQPEGPGDHAAGTGGFLTCRHVKKSEDDIQNGVSMDQVYAQALGDATPIASLQLGIEGGTGIGNCDSGYSCAYTRNISWADAVTPLPKLTSPQLAFDLMFGGADPEATAEEIARRRHYRLSVLDYVYDDALALQMNLGVTDKVKLEQYLDGIRELEMRIEKESMGPVCETGNFSGNFENLQGHVRSMLDLIVLALACDTTRVVSFMLGNGGSGQVYDFLGLNAGHHDLSHHGGNPDLQAQLQIIDTWEVAQFAYLLDRLRSVTEGESNMLENSLVFFSSEIEDGNSHSHYNLPVLVGGSGGGKIVNGQHLSFDDGKVSQLFLAMLQALGVDIASFGDDGMGVGALDSILV
ncbi:DUF1552 domain-containing protein [Nannocystaceae bacterium ST9]